MNNIDDGVLREYISKYDQTRKRLSHIDSKYKTCSDKEIIEYLVDEIEQYRSRIHFLSKLMQNETSRDDTLVAMYKADIYEYGSGRTEICYECDKDKNKECNKKYCLPDCCTHTLDKKYAKNFAKT